jgi:hypothetical protein
VLDGIYASARDLNTQVEGIILQVARSSIVNVVWGAIPCAHTYEGEGSEGQPEMKHYTVSVGVRASAFSLAEKFAAPFFSPIAVQIGRRFSIHAAVPASAIYYDPFVENGTGGAQPGPADGGTVEITGTFERNSARRVNDEGYPPEFADLHGTYTLTSPSYLGTCSRGAANEEVHGPEHESVGNKR